MNKGIRIAALAASVAALAACNWGEEGRAEGGTFGTGAVTSRDYQVGTFSEIALGGPHDVEFKAGPDVSVRAEGPSDILDVMEIKVEDGKLLIGIKKMRSFRMAAGAKAVKVTVTAPTVSALSIGGSGDIVADSIEGAKLDTAIGGSGDITVGAVKVDTASASIAGSGTIKLTGTAGSTSTNIAGSGDVDLSGLQADIADANIVGSGNASLYARKSAEVKIMGSGDVTVAGGGTCQTSKMGSGSVTCTK